MSSDHGNQVLRLPKRHSRNSAGPPDRQLGARLANAQSPRSAITAGFVVIVIFSSAWAMLSAYVGRVFPWLTLLQALLVGLAVRRAGRGIDWRFPAIASAFAVLGALAGNIVVAAAFTAAEYDTGTLTVLRAVTSLTWPVFFDEVMTGADAVYALGSAGIAAFYANRRLTRAEFAAYRAWREADDHDG